MRIGVDILCAHKVVKGGKKYFVLCKNENFGAKQDFSCVIFFYLLYRLKNVKFLQNLSWRHKCRDVHVKFLFNFKILKCFFLVAGEPPRSLCDFFFKRGKNIVFYIDI